MGEARIIASKICRTFGGHRPFPSLFYFPGLTSKPYHDPKTFAFQSLLEENYASIRKEYEQNSKLYKKNDYTPGEDEHKVEGSEWRWIAHTKKGHRNKDFEQMFPKTTAILSKIEDLATGIPFSYVYFSTLQPGTSIPHHYGACNIKLRCHLPLFIPEDCFLRVAGDPHHWEEGKLMIFDDTFEHESANFGEKGERTVLLFDIWHPELTKEERSAVREVLTQLEKKVQEKVETKSN